MNLLCEMLCKMLCVAEGVARRVHTYHFCMRRSGPCHWIAPGGAILLLAETSSEVFDGAKAHHEAVSHDTVRHGGQSGENVIISTPAAGPRACRPPRDTGRVYSGEETGPGNWGVTGPPQAGL